MKENIYAATLGGTSGTLAWINGVGLADAFTVLIIKTIVVAIVSTLTGIIVKKLYYKIFPDKK